MRLLHADLVPAIWVLWLAYWILSGRGTKPIARTESVASRVSHMLPLAAGIVLFNVHGGTLGQRRLPETEAVFWTGTAILVAGLLVAVWARVHLAGNWSGTVTLKHGHSLIRSGPYAWVRHPIYTGLLVALVGTAITSGTWAALLGLLAVIAAFLRKIVIEERFLRSLFGDVYARYRAEVPALLPWPHRRG